MSFSNPQSLYQATGGASSSAPLITVFMPRDPTSNDIFEPSGQYDFGQRWINTNTHIEWFLDGFISSNGQLTANWVILSGKGFLAINRQVFTSSGNYIPTSGMIYCDIEVVGGGGAGGAGTTNPGSGGGAGGYAQGIFNAGIIGGSQIVTVGAANGTSSVGALISATGGTNGSNSSLFNQGGIGGVGAGGDFQTIGEVGETSIFINNNVMVAGNGGCSFFGGSGLGAVQNGAASSIAATNATSYGGGGGGGVAISQTPGTGYPGIVIITEYIS